MSADSNGYVVLFKSVSESENGEKDIYYETFHSAGFQVSLIPVLDFEFINLNELLIKLKNSDDYAGIIFSSPRCVTAVKSSVNEANDQTVLDKWKNHKNYAVGEKTGEMVEDLRLQVDGKEAGNGEKLADIICKDSHSKPFLYPIGSLTQPSFKLKLKANNVEVDDITVYQTKPHPNLEEKIMKLKDQLVHKSVYFIYFSPSGVNFTLPIFKKLHIDINQVKFVAIGPTTDSSLTENGLQVANTSTKPNPTALLNAVLSLKT